MLDSYKQKRVFVTGHSGFKGSWLSLYLLSLNAKVYGYSLAPNTNPNHFDLLQLKDKMHSNFGDILNVSSLQKALREADPEIIFHLAAQPLVRESYKDPLYTFNTNAIGTLNVLNCARELKNLKAIIIITTDKVYENKEWLWGYRENDALGGYDPYSASKACAEIITDSMRRSFFNVESFGKTHSVLIATTRAGNVIGGGDWSIDRLIPDLIKAANKNEQTIIRNPNSTRPWQHVLEPLRGYLMLGEQALNGNVEFASSFNFGPSLEGNIKVKEVLEIAKNEWSNINYKVESKGDEPHEAGLLMLDSTKAQRMLNWIPKLTHKDAIKNSILWYKQYYQNGKILSQEQLEEYKALNG